MTSLAAIATSHIGEPGGVNTCLRAVNRWAEEAGAHALPTESVSQAVQLAKAGGRSADAFGWTYHEGLDGAKPGDVLRWARHALQPTSDNPNPEHVTVWTDTDHDGNIRSVGSGGPTGTVAQQPRGGGFNPRSTFRGYFRLTVDAKPAQPAKPAAKPAAAGVIVVKRGETLIGIAQRERTTVARLMAANPKARDGRTQDYHITRANLILVGQRLHRP